MGRLQALGFKAVKVKIERGQDENRGAARFNAPGKFVQNSNFDGAAPVGIVQEVNRIGTINRGFEVLPDEMKQETRPAPVGFFLHLARPCSQFCKALAD